MDHRRTHRFAIGEEVGVKVYGTPEREYLGTVKDASSQGLGLYLQEHVAPGSALRIELADAIILGEVVYCGGENGRYLVGVRLKQALNGLAELARMMRAFDEELLPGDMAYALQQRRGQDR
jgi:hypothetical protein